MIIRNKVLDTWLAAESSPVDWCEENYTVSSSIAEFTNTLSNILFIILPGFCFYSKLWSSYSRHVSRGAQILLALYIIIGLSSMYFHATLSLLGQLLDEVYIIWALCIGYSSLTPNQYRPKFFQGVMAHILAVSMALALTVLWFVAPYTNAFWLMLISTPIVAMKLREILVYKNPVTLRITRLSLSLCCVSILIWFADRAMCRVWLNLGIPGLHNIWHLLSAIVIYLTLTIFAYWKVLADSPLVQPTMRYTPGRWWGIPYVQCKEKLHN